MGGMLSQKEVDVLMSAFDSPLSEAEKREWDERVKQGNRTMAQEIADEKEFLTQEIERLGIKQGDLIALFSFGDGPVVGKFVEVKLEKIIINFLSAETVSNLRDHPESIDSLDKWEEAVIILDINGRKRRYAAITAKGFPGASICKVHDLPGLLDYIYERNKELGRCSPSVTEDEVRNGAEVLNDFPSVQ